VNGAFGRYRLLERLGQGGMAEVFKAKSFGVEGFEKVLVIKRILPELARRPDFVRVFIHEAKLAVRLSHANIVQVFDLGTAPGGDVDGVEQPDSYYIATEYVHGLDLSTLLDRCLREHLALPLQMAVFIGSEIAKGLDHAHRRRDEQMRPLGIVHLDVSPQNVLLSFEGEVKVTDFCIAKARRLLEPEPNDTQNRGLEGKFAYMSPEQARGEAVSASSDLFSLGTILYECVAGVNPFSAPTALETLQRVEACDCPPIELLRPDTPRELVDVVRTAMTRDPADRYADAGRMYEDLLAILYAQGSRYGAHDLAEFLKHLRGRSDGRDGSVPPPPLLETDAPTAAVEQTACEDAPTPRETDRGPEEAFGRFVGRKEELRRIGELIARASKHRAQVLTIRGDHGVGKTRLLHEVERRLLRGQYSVGFHIATCPPQATELPLLGIACMLHVLCGTTEGDSHDRILALQPRLRALGLPGDEVNAVLVALGASVPTGDGDAKALLKQAFTRVVQSLCDDRPHCFAWDVAHAMDEESFGVLAHVLERSAQARVLFILSTRAGFSHLLETCEGHASLDLGDLAPADLERLVGSRLAVDAVPEELVRFVRARAGGHPLFVEELLKALVDAGAVSVAERHVVSMMLVGQDLALPKTLRGLVGSRVARLGQGDRTTLQAAAVLGDSLDVKLLSEMLGMPMPTIEQSIATLVDRGLLALVSARDLRFTSPIIPEVVVDALTAEAARELHAAAARALETTLAERAGEQTARIAGHIYEAGEPDRAAGYFAESARRHLEASRLEAAANDYTRAIALVDADRPAGVLAGWLDGLASAMRLVRTAPDAPYLCSRVIEREDRTGDRQASVRARVAAGHILAAVHLLEASRQRLAEAEMIASGDEQLLRLALIAEVELATRQGDYKRALVLLVELHTMAHATSDEREQHRVSLQLALSRAGLGDRPTALAHLEEATGLLGGDRTAEMERARVRALVDFYTRDFQSAAVHFARAIDMGRELGLTHVVLVNLYHLGEVLVRLGDLPRAYGAIRQSLALCEERGDERFANRNAMLLAYLDGLKDDGDSEQRIRTGIEYARSKGFTNDVIRGKLLLAHGLAREGRIATARDEYDTTRAMAVDAGQRLVADDCETALVGLPTALTKELASEEATSQ
jgi:serine/threonine protein kinase/tetratricopeptide (TPR) repeat protein